MDKPETGIFSVEKETKNFMESEKLKKDEPIKSREKNFPDRKLHPLIPVEFKENPTFWGEMNNRKWD